MRVQSKVLARKSQKGKTTCAAQHDGRGTTGADAAQSAPHIGKNTEEHSSKKRNTGRWKNRAKTPGRANKA